MVSYNGHLYGRVQLLYTWTEANEYAQGLTCCKRTGSLVSIETVPEKQGPVADLLKQGNGYVMWLGAHTKDEHWVWAGTGAPVDSTNVMPGFSDSYAPPGYASYAYFSMSVATYYGRPVNYASFHSMVEFACRG
jgi:hypothetical protein